MKLNDFEYELIENYKDAFDLEAVLNRITDYYDDYDYIVGDFAYGKLRLKGFCDKNNKLYKEYNDISKKDEYVKKECAYDCKYFVLKKIK